MSFGAPLTLEGGHTLRVGRLPARLREAIDFEALWAMHPERPHRVRMYGRWVDTPRYQAAYGADYRYSGTVNPARPVPPRLEAIRDWAREAIDPRLDGLLLNWYDAAEGHYMGPHRDYGRDLTRGAPIVTVSFGAPRIFRIRPHGGGPFVDLDATDGDVFVMPWATNRAFTHAVPRRAADRGRRVSVTLRAFRPEAARLAR